MAVSGIVREPAVVAAGIGVLSVVAAGIGVLSVVAAGIGVLPGVATSAATGDRVTSDGRHRPHSHPTGGPVLLVLHTTDAGQHMHCVYLRATGLGLGRDSRCTVDGPPDRMVR